MPEVYSVAALVEIDFSQKRVLRRMAMARDEMDHSLDGYATNFTVPARVGNELYLPSHATVYNVDIDRFETKDQFSNPFFNDLHQVALYDGSLYAVSTGLDRVLKLDGSGEVVGVLPVHPSIQPLQTEEDYRTSNTKPRLSHPNFLFEAQGMPWVTRAHQHDCVPLHDLHNPFPLADVMVHDGIAWEDKHIFTSVNGDVIVTDLVNRKVVQTYHLIRKRWHLLTGWCRALHVTDDHFYVGFSVFRRTKFVENLQWVKAALKGDNPPLPTRIEKISRATGQVVDEMTFDPKVLNAIFWIGPVSQAPANEEAPSARAYSSDVDDDSSEASHPSAKRKSQLSLM
ncbi:MAG: hypothetical protein ABI579_00835 [Candidatus Sumerlaeota bacterium]